MFNNVQSPSPTEAAKTEIIRLFQIECDLTGKRRQKMLDLDAIRHGAAQAIVDGTAGIEDAAARVAQRQTEVAAAEEAIAIVRQRRVKAIQQRYKAEAGEMRAIAARYRQEAADILKRCEPLLRKLSDLQGLTYSSSILLAQRNSQWTGSYITGAPLEECNPIEATADIIRAQNVRNKPDVSALAGLDKNKLAVLVWHYHDDDLAGPAAAVDLNLDGLPYANGTATLTQYVIDADHSNSYEAWKRMGEPEQPSPEQHAKLEAAGKLAELDEPKSAAVQNGAAKISLNLPRQAVALLVFTWKR